MKKTKHHTYSLMAVMMASSNNPMPEFMITHQLTRMHGGLHAMLRGDDPKPEDWRVVVDAVNMMETLVIQGKIVDDSCTLADATVALTAAAQRSVQGNGIRLDAKGISVIRGVLEDYETVLSFLSHREMMICHRATEKRIWDIKAGKRQSHDIVVTSI